MTILQHSPWSAPILAAAFSAAALALLLRSRSSLPQDYPTERSLHQRPVSRVGGIAIWTGFLPVALLSPAPTGDGRVWLVSWAIVTGVSFADDWWGVRPAVRLAFHALAGLAIVSGLATMLVPAVAQGARSQDREVFAMFGATWLAVIAFAFAGNYPTPLVGYGSSAILGYCLSAAVLSTHPSVENGAPGRIRTCGLWLRGSTFYPTELRAVC